jgi:uncharacterized protein (DUF924 family)
MRDAVDRLLGHWFRPEPETTTEAEALFDRWFVGGADVDRDIETRYGALARAAAAGELDDWATGARGRLALILLLDQVPRHVHRGTAAAFEQDEKALALTSSGIENEMDRELPPLQRAFFYMPLQHSESRDAQELSVRRYEALAGAHIKPPVGPMLRQFADHARMHRDIVARFGRFPHRNPLLGRADAAEERRFMNEGGPSFGQ